MIVAAMYLLYMLGKVVWGPLVEPAGHASHGSHDSHADQADHAHHAPVLPPDLNRREILTLVPLAVLCIALGVYPQPMLQALQTPIERVVQRIDGARMVPEAVPAVSAPLPLTTSSDASSNTASDLSSMPTPSDHRGPALAQEAGR